MMGFRGDWPCGGESEKRRVWGRNTRHFVEDYWKNEETGFVN